MKVTKEMIEAGARALERRYHRENGVCDARDGGPRDCWKSMRGFARVAVAAAARVSRPKEKR